MAVDFSDVGSKFIQKFITTSINVTQNALPSHPRQTIMGEVVCRGGGILALFRGRMNVSTVLYH